MVWKIKKLHKKSENFQKNSKIVLENQLDKVYNFFFCTIFFFCKKKYILQWLPGEWRVKRADEQTFFSIFYVG